MTLVEYLIEEHARVERFGAMWLEGSKATPDQFPEEMDLGEWCEQFLSFESM